MKMLLIAIGFGGVVFANNYPTKSAEIAHWVETNKFMVGLMR
jgi:hypothetical protein